MKWDWKNKFKVNRQIQTYDNNKQFLNYVLNDKTSIQDEGDYLDDNGRMKGRQNIVNCWSDIVWGKKWEKRGTLKGERWAV